MKLFVGLGNPGPHYAETRHNIGFMVIDELVRRFPIQQRWTDTVADTYQATIDQHRVLLVKPQTYMNLSGVAVHRAARNYAVAVQDIVVVYDDLDLPVGRLRVRKHGGHGGHKGVRSIIEHLESSQFARLRMGIGRPGSATRDAEAPSPETGEGPRDRIVEYVLRPFTRAERPVMQDAVGRAADALRIIAAGQIDAAMNAFNRR